MLVCRGYTHAHKEPITTELPEPVNYAFVHLKAECNARMVADEPRNVVAPKAQILPDGIAASAMTSS